MTTLQQCIQFHAESTRDFRLHTAVGGNASQASSVGTWVCAAYMTDKTCVFPPVSTPRRLRRADVPVFGNPLPPSPPAIELPPSTPPPAAPPTDGFFWGDLGQSCDDACAFHGLTCNNGARGCRAPAAAEHAAQVCDLCRPPSDNTLGVDITQCSNYEASINSAAPFFNTANGRCGYGMYVDEPSMFGGRHYSYNCAGVPASDRAAHLLLQHRPAAVAAATVAAATHRRLPPPPPSPRRRPPPSPPPARRRSRPCRRGTGSSLPETTLAGSTSRTRSLCATTWAAPSPSSARADEQREAYDLMKRVALTEHGSA